MAQSYQRPWWLLVNKTTRLISKVREESQPGERTIIVRGEPIIQGLAWLIWGPIAALISISLIGFLAFSFRHETGMMKACFALLFLIIPAFSWIITSVLLARISQPYVLAEKEAESEEVRLHLNQKDGILSYRTKTSEGQIPYNAIKKARATQAIGGSKDNIFRLVLDTDEGLLVLLDEELGTQEQKFDLAKEIQTELALYAEKSTDS